MTSRISSFLDEEKPKRNKLSSFLEPKEPERSFGETVVDTGLDLLGRGQRTLGNITEKVFGRSDRSRSFIESGNKNIRLALQRQGKLRDKPPSISNPTPQSILDTVEATVTNAPERLEKTGQSLGLLISDTAGLGKFSSGIKDRIRSLDSQMNAQIRPDGLGGEIASAVTGALIDAPLFAATGIPGIATLSGAEGFADARTDGKGLVPSLAFGGAKGALTGYLNKKLGTYERFFKGKGGIPAAALAEGIEEAGEQAADPFLRLATLSEGNIATENGPVDLFSSEGLSQYASNVGKAFLIGNIAGGTIRGGIDIATGQFKSPTLRNQFESELTKNLALIEQENTLPGSVTLEDALNPGESNIQKIAAGVEAMRTLFKGAKELNVRIEDLGNSRVEGFAKENDIVINKNINPDRLFETLVHEDAGHFLIKDLMGELPFQRLLADIQQSLPNEVANLKAQLDTDRLSVGKEPTTNEEVAEEMVAFGLGNLTNEKKGKFYRTLLANKISNVFGKKFTERTLDLKLREAFLKYRDNPLTRTPKLDIVKSQGNPFLADIQPGQRTFVDRNPISRKEISRDTPNSFIPSAQPGQRTVITKGKLTRQLAETQGTEDSESTFITPQPGQRTVITKGKPARQLAETQGIKDSEPSFVTPQPGQRTVITRGSPSNKSAEISSLTKDNAINPSLVSPQPGQRTFIDRKKPTREIRYSIFDAHRELEDTSNIIQKVMDRHDPIRKLQIEKGGPKDEVYQKLRMLKAAPQSFALMIKKGLFNLKGNGELHFDSSTQGLEEDFIKPLGPHRQLYFEYRAARRAQQLLKEGKEKLFTQPEIDKIMNKVTPAHRALFDSTDKVFEKYNNAFLDIAVQGGYLDVDKRNRFRSDLYVPFKRVAEDPMGFYANSNVNGVINEGIKALKGSSKKIDESMFENTLSNWYYLFQGAMENKAIGDAIEFLQRTAPQALKKTDKTKPNITVGYMKDGELKRFDVTDKKWFDALVSMPSGQKQFGEVIQMANNLLRYGVTSTPGFVQANIIRDTLQAAMVNKSFVPVWDSMRGVWNAWNRTDTYWDIMLNGGGFGNGYDVVLDKTKLKKHLDKITTNQNTFNPFRKTIEFWERVKDSSESAGRIGVYLRELESGASIPQAAFKSRDLMDFSQDGTSEKVRMMTQLVPFLRSRISGISRLHRTATEPETRAIFAAKASALVATSIGYYAMQMAFNKDEYENLNDEDRLTYWHFWINDNHFRIPKPFELGAFFSSVPESILRTAYGSSDIKDLGDDARRIVMESLMFNPIPQVIKPSLETALNINMFTGRPIVSSFLQDAPTELQFTSATSSTSRKLGELGISPLKADHFIRGTFGTLGAYTLGAIDLIVDSVDPATGKLGGSFMDRGTDYFKEIAGINRFMPPDELRTSTKSVNDFYEFMGEIRKTSKMLKHYNQTGKLNPDIYREKSFILAPIGKQFSNTIKNFRNQKRQILMSELPREDKEKMIISINDRIKAQASFFSRIVQQYDL